MKIKSAKFLRSDDSTSFFNDGIPEIAFVGRSNVGKSSLLNNLCQKKDLARTSKTPGRTRLINYFSINDSFRFVDLPGYGFHLAGKQLEKKWSIILERYLLENNDLKLVILLLDSRHNPSELDKVMINFLYSNQIPFIVIATKCDKLPKSKIKNNISTLAKEIKIPVGNIFAHSSENSFGREQILDYIENFLTKEN